ncbi:MAG: ComEC family competence protein, partial [Bacteroidota bacterium]
MKVFLTIPFFRILIPFVAGIIIAIHYAIPPFSWVFFLALIIIISGLLFFKRSTGFNKTALLVLADVFLLMYGMTLVSHCSKNNQTLFYGRVVSPGTEQTFIAVIDDLPLEKEKSFKLSLQILEIKTGRYFKKATGNIFTYVRKSIKTKQLKAGDVLMLRLKLQDLPGPKNPFEFNYKNYLANRQIYHSTFVDSTAYTVLPTGGYLNPVWATGLLCKNYILKQLKSGGLTSNSYAICAALLTGYDDEIDKAVMEAFSHSGTLHVLSVSGLHTGLIYLVLGFLFDLADRKKKHKLLKFVFITLVLWLFALITGFSSPVLRAVIMFNLLGLGKIYFRNDAGNQMNILLVSAFMLLVYNPFFINDVGFQLSYFALAGLI